MIGLLILLLGIGTALLGLIGLGACLVMWDISALLPNLGLLAVGLVMGAAATAILE